MTDRRPTRAPATAPQSRELRCTTLHDDSLHDDSLANVDVEGLDSPDKNEGENISLSKRRGTARCTTTERPLTTRDSAIPFSRTSLKRLASIAARIDAVGAVMKVADSPVRRLEASRLLENLSLEVHNFYRELMNDFRYK
jgi:hypothetical protein